MTEPPSPAERLQIDSLFDYCVKRMAAVGIPVVLDPHLKKLGECHRDYIVIALRDDIEPHTRLRVLFHEWSHMYPHQRKHGIPTVPSDEQEFEADCVAIRLFDHLGLSGKADIGWHEHLNTNLQVIARREPGYFQKRVDATVWLLWSYLTKNFDTF